MMFKEIFFKYVEKKLYDIHFDLNINNVNIEYQHIIENSNANEYEILN